MVRQAGWIRFGKSRPPPVADIVMQDIPDIRADFAHIQNKPQDGDIEHSATEQAMHPIMTILGGRLYDAFKVIRVQDGPRRQCVPNGLRSELELGVRLSGPVMTETPVGVPDLSVRSELELA